MNRAPSLTILALLGAISTGCATERAAVAPVPASTGPATQVSDDQLADPQWWLAQPGVGSVSGGDFEKLWATSEQVARKYLFAIDRRDRRGGLLTTQPTVSAQWFEPWRRELQTGSDLADSSMATHRRTIYFNFEKQGDGQYTVTPKVVVERQALAERRVTAVLERSHFRRDPNSETFGSRELDQGVILPTNYWYPVDRDRAFEQKLVEDLRVALR